MFVIINWRHLLFEGKRGFEVLTVWKWCLVCPPKTKFNNLQSSTQHYLMPCLSVWPYIIMPCWDVHILPSVMYWTAFQIKYILYSFPWAFFRNRPLFIAFTVYTCGDSLRAISMGNANRHRFTRMCTCTVCTSHACTVAYAGLPYVRTLKCLDVDSGFSFTRSPRLVSLFIFSSCFGNILVDYSKCG